MSWSVHENMLFGELCIIFVRCHHIYIILILVCKLCYGSHHIVSFISIHFKDVYVVRFNYLFNNRNRELNVFGRFFALSFVFFKLFVSKCKPRRIKSHSNVRRVFFSKNLFECIYKAKYGRCVESLRVYSGVSNECIIRSINECISIK